MAVPSRTDDEASARIRRIFEPSSIAVIGASTDPAKRGHQILRALAESGYRGGVHPVNPRGGEILGRRVITSVEELPPGVDLAVLCTPAHAAPDLVRSCGARGIAGVVVLAVGFGESGADGRSLEDELRAAGRDGGVRIIGPNTSGMLNLERGVNLVGARGVRAGGLAILVQSGNMALALMTEVTERSWDGISVSLGVGNEVDLGFAETLEFLEGHEGTRAILVHAEGLADAGAFLETAARVSRTKPVVALKAGRTARGAEAALSHTGSVAGPYRRLSAGLAQAGIVEVRRSDELLHVAETLGRQPTPPPGSGIAILSDGGGQGTLAVDALVEARAPMASLDPRTRDGLRRLLGPAAAVDNPVDLAGAADADPEVFGRAVELLVGDPAVGSVLVVGLFGGYGIRFAEQLTAKERTAAAAMADHARSAGRGLVVHTMYALHRSLPLAELGTRGVPVVASLDVACRCVVELHRRGEWLACPPWAYRAPSPTADPTHPPPDRIGRREPSHPIVTRAVEEGRNTLTEPEARDVLTARGATFAPAVVASSPDAVVDAFRAFDAPVAVKLISWRITHKSDAGGVLLDVSSEAEARAAFETIQGRTAAREPCRVLVTPMLPPPRAELLVGAYRDVDLGPVVSVGAGGLWVEALGDVSVRVLPVTDAEILEMVGEATIGALLGAGRGRPAVDLEPLVRAVRPVIDAIVLHPDLLEVEVNPLFVYEDRVVPVDARIGLRQPGSVVSNQARGPGGAAGEPPGTAPPLGG